MKAVLIEKDGTEHSINIDNADIKVVITEDASSRPPVRIFLYASMPYVHRVPAFVEIDFSAVAVLPARESVLRKFALHILNNEL